MKKILSLLWLLLLIFSSPLLSQKIVQTTNAQVRQVSQFSAISVSGALDIIISQSNETVVVVDASDVNMRNNITTEVVNGNLHIGYKSNVINFKGNKWLKVYITVPAITKIAAGGSSDIYIEGVYKADDLEITLSGASDFHGTLISENLRLTGSGSADFNISGQCNNLRIAVSGASDVKGKNFTAEYCDIAASGSSDVRIRVNKELKAAASGASDIIYYGEASLRNHVSSGSSSIKRSN